MNRGKGGSQEKWKKGHVHARRKFKAHCRMVRKMSYILPETEELTNATQCETTSQIFRCGLPIPGLLCSANPADKWRLNDNHRWFIKAKQTAMAS